MLNVPVYSTQKKHNAGYMNRKAYIGYFEYLHDIDVNLDFFF